MKLKAQLFTSAQNIRTAPHQPKSWFARGKTLLEFGYPELVAGDFEKTLLLVEHGLDASLEPNSELGENVRSPGIQKWIKEYRGVSCYPANVPEEHG